MGTLAAPSRQSITSAMLWIPLCLPVRRKHINLALDPALDTAENLALDLSLALDQDQHWYAFASIHHTNILKLRSLWLLRAMEHRERNVKSIII